MIRKSPMLGRVKVLVATTLTLLLSVAQSAETGVSHHGTNGFDPLTGGFGVGFERELPRRFTDIDIPDISDESKARVILSRTDKFGEMSVVEIRTNEFTRTHFNFHSYATEEMLSATLVVKNKLRFQRGGRSEFLDRAHPKELSESPSVTIYSLSFDLPSGQILLEDNVLSLITASGFSRMELSESEVRGAVTEHFAFLLNDVLRGSDMSGFGLSMAESLAESGSLPLPFVGHQNSKGDNQHIEGAWGCAGALIVLTAANGALAAALAGTYATFGMAAATIAGAVSAIGVAMTAVDVYCLQMGTA